MQVVGQDLIDNQSDIMYDNAICSYAKQSDGRPKTKQLLLPKSSLETFLLTRVLFEYYGFLVHC